MFKKEILLSFIFLVFVLCMSVLLHANINIKEYNNNNSNDNNNNNNDNIQYYINNVCGQCRYLEEMMINETVLSVKNFMTKYVPNLCESAAMALSYAVVLASKKNDVNPMYAAAIAYVESNFNPAAISSSGAAGIFQVMKFNRINKNSVDFGINSESGIRVLRRCLNKTNNNCIESYICYVYGENGYKLKIDSPDLPPTVNRLSVILMVNKIYNCGNFVYY